MLLIHGNRLFKASRTYGGLRRSLPPGVVHLPGGSLRSSAATYGARPSSTIGAASQSGISMWTVTTALLGLPLGLWAYKCLMMYIFQRKIIYMGYVPPGARQEKVKDVSVPSSVTCEEVQIESEPSVSLSGLVLGNTASGPRASGRAVVVYFQGNAGSPLHRLNKFAALLNVVPSAVIVAVAPRSYWSSTKARVTQKGMTTDYGCVLSYAAAQFPDSQIVVYGHSLGASIAACVLDCGAYPAVYGVVLENPFSSVPAMVSALYPQRWLPYHHMGPLVWDQWNALHSSSQPQPGSALARLRKHVLVLVSERDELVPPEMGYRIAEAAGSRLVVLRGALHETAWMKRQWADEIVKYIRNIEDKP